jgi:hypothetical protein
MSDPGTTIRFLCDEDFHGSIVRGLRRARPQMDILTAVEAGTMGLGDPLVLEYAATHGRILLSRDNRTMSGHVSAFLSAGYHSPGLILASQALTIGQVIQDIVLIWEASAAAEYQDLITRLPLLRGPHRPRSVSGLRSRLIRGCIARG